MVISETLRNYLSEELNIVAGKMKEVGNPADKLYYFSAVYGALQRTLNMEYSRPLCLLHFVCLSAYSTVQQRLTLLSQGQDRSVTLSPDTFDALSDLTSQLATRIKNNEDVTEVLEQMSEVAYSTTGNGFYLQSIGRLNY